MYGELLPNRSTKKFTENLEKLFNNANFVNGLLFAHNAPGYNLRPQGLTSDKMADS